MLVVVFMHTYPADLGKQAAAISELIDASPAVLVDMGHTHYNELSNDGRTIYAATRSTGQIEEGEIGFALVVVDRGVVSWRFKTLGSPWPFVMVTSPADHRLATDTIREPEFQVRASAWSAQPISRAELQIDDSAWSVMRHDGDGVFSANVEAPACRVAIRVRVTDASGGEDIDEIAFDPAPSRRFSTGSDTNRLEAWPERHLLGTQLGPNRNGRKW